MKNKLNIFLLSVFLAGCIETKPIVPEKINSTDTIVDIDKNGTHDSICCCEYCLEE
jgi:hypothetical protein